MHIQRRYDTCLGMSKKKRKRKDSPLSKKKRKRDGAYKGVHTPSTKYIHTLAHLNQGLWLVSPLDPVFDLAKYGKQVCLQILHTYSSTKTAIRDRLRKKGIIMPWWGIIHIDRSDRSSEELYKILLQNLRNDSWTKEKKYEHSMIPF